MANATDTVLAKVIASHKFAKQREVDEARTWGARYHPNKDLAELLFMRGVIDRAKVAMIRKLAKMQARPSERAPAQGQGSQTVEPPAAPDVDQPVTKVKVTKLRHKEPETVGRYEILERVAQGGMGVIYKARHPDLDRLFAVKLLTPRTQASQEATARFQREAKIAARLDHPNIVRVYDAGMDEGQPYLVMDFVDGPNLDQLIKEEGLGVRKAAQLTRSIALALHHAHENGVVHRDVKPENIIIDRASGEPKITDFGIVKELEGDPEGSKLTQTGFTLGSPCYMSPEQAEGLHDLVGPRSDVYSLAASLYEMLTGDPPFDGESIHEIMTRVVRDDPVAVLTKNPAVPPDLDVVCMKALEKEQERRYETARKLAEDLDRFLKEEPVLAKPVGARTKAYRFVRRNRTTTALVSLFVLLSAVALGFVVHRDRQRRQEQQERLEERIALAEQRLTDAAKTQDPLEKRQAYYDALRVLETVLEGAPTHQLAKLRRRAVVLALGDHLIESGETSFAEFVFLRLGPANSALIASRIQAARLGTWVKKAESAEQRGELRTARELYRKGLRSLEEVGYKGERLKLRIATLDRALARQKQRTDVKELVALAEASARKGDHAAAYQAYRQALALAPGERDLQGHMKHHRQKALAKVLRLKGEATSARARVGQITLKGFEKSLKELQAQGDAGLQNAAARVERDDFPGAERLLKQAAVHFRTAYALTRSVQARGQVRAAALEAERLKASRYAAKELGTAKDLHLQGDEAFERGDHAEALKHYTQAAASYRRAARTGGSKSVVAEARESSQKVRAKLLRALGPHQRTPQFKTAESDFKKAEKHYDRQEYARAKDLYARATAGFEQVLALAPFIRQAFASQSRVRKLRKQCEGEMALEFASNDFSRGRSSELAGDRALGAAKPREASKHYATAVYRYERALKRARPHASNKRGYDDRLQKVMDARQTCVDEKVDWKTAFKRAEEHVRKAKQAMKDRYWSGAKRHLDRALKLYTSLHPE